MALAWYTSREAVMDALDVKASAYTSAQIDRAIDSGAEGVDSLCRRSFPPILATKSFPYPNVRQNEAWTLWLDANTLISLTSLVSGGVTVPAAGYYLEPNEYGPPYDRIEINRGSSYAFSGGSSGPQRSNVVTGLFGYTNDEADEGTLAAGIASASVTTMTASKPIGVGRVLRIDSERLIVTEKSFITSGQTVLTPLTANLNNQTLSVTDGTQFQLRESLLIDAERVLVVDIAGNNLIIKRAQQGTTLAAHTSSTIYWGRSLTVTRGALGTTAGTHSIGASVVRWKPPALVEQLNIAYALDRGLQESAGYSRTVGSGDNVRNASGRGIRELESNVLSAHGRKARQRAV